MALVSQFLDGSGIINAISAGVRDQTAINRQMQDLMETSQRLARQGQADKYNRMLLDEQLKNQGTDGGVAPKQMVLAGKSDALAPVPSSGPTAEAPGITGRNESAPLAKPNMLPDGRVVTGTKVSGKVTDRLDQLADAANGLTPQGTEPRDPSGAAPSRVTEPRDPSGVIKPITHVAPKSTNKVDQELSYTPQQYTTPYGSTQPPQNLALPRQALDSYVENADAYKALQSNPLTDDRRNFTRRLQIPDSPGKPNNLLGDARRNFVPPEDNTARLVPERTPKPLTLREGIIGTAGRLRMDPTWLATFVSFETGGTFDPTKKGPVTQYGQHEGAIQFGEPQAQQYGYDRNNPIESQFGEGGAVEKYFLDRGWKPGMSMLDGYSIINAGSPGRYNASDANNGGAPGTVAQKVAGMGDHIANAQRFLGQPDFEPTLPSRLQDPKVEQSVRDLYTGMAAQFGEDFNIKSGYRNKAQNIAAFGADKSQHLHGRAMDIESAGFSKEKRRSLLAWAIDNPNVGGIGLYPSGNTHFDTLPRVDGVLRVWGKDGDYNSDPAVVTELMAMTPEARRALYADGREFGGTAGRTYSGGAEQPVRYAPRGGGARFTPQSGAPNSRDALEAYLAGPYGPTPNIGTYVDAAFGFPPTSQQGTPQQVGAAPTPNQRIQTGVDLSQYAAPQGATTTYLDVLARLLQPIGQSQNATGVDGFGALSAGAGF